MIPEIRELIEIITKNIDRSLTKLEERGIKCDTMDWDGFIDYTLDLYLLEDRLEAKYDLIEKKTKCLGHSIGTDCVICCDDKQEDYKNASKS